MHATLTQVRTTNTVCERRQRFTRHPPKPNENNNISGRTGRPVRILLWPVCVVERRFPQPSLKPDERNPSLTR